MAAATVLTAAVVAAGAGAATGAGSAVQTAAAPTPVRAWGTEPGAAAVGTPSLVGVAAVSATEAYAVGSQDEGPNQQGVGLAVFAERWDGSSWTETPVTAPHYGDDQHNQLNSVVAPAPSDAWAVGEASYRPYASQHTLAEHWDGTSWKAVATPNPGSSGQHALDDVAAAASDDVWAVGLYQSSSTGGRSSLVLRWDGATWKRVSVPDIGPLTSVTIDAAGTVYVSNSDIVLRSNRSGWSRLPVLPAQDGIGTGGPVNALAFSGGDLWAVGGEVTDGGGGGGRTPQAGAARPDYPGDDRYDYAAYFDGTRWTFVDPGGNNPASDVVATPSGVTATIGTTAVSLTTTGATDEVTPVGPDQGLTKSIAADRAGRLWVVGGDYGKTSIITSPGIGQGGAIVDTTGALVSWSGPSSGTTTPDEGRALIGGLPVGSYTFTANANGCAPASVRARVRAGRAVAVTLPLSC